MILLAANCIAAPIRWWGPPAWDAHFISRVRCDVLAQTLRGNPPTVDYAEIRSHGLDAYALRQDYAHAEVKAFVWTNYMDEAFTFYDIGGVPFSPDFKGRGKHPSEIYPTLPKMPIIDRIPHWRAADAALNQINPVMRKILVIYDPSRLSEFFAIRPNKGDTLEGHCVSAAVMCHVLQPLGWEPVFIPWNAPKRPDEEAREWAHYDNHVLWERAFKPLLEATCPKV